MARNAACIFAALVTAADDDVVNVFRVERTFVHDRLDDVTEQVVRTDAREYAAVAAER